MLAFANIKVGASGLALGAWRFVSLTRNPTDWVTEPMSAFVQQIHLILNFRFDFQHSCTLRSRKRRAKEKTIWLAS